MCLEMFQIEYLYPSPPFNKKILQNLKPNHIVLWWLCFIAKVTSESIGRMVGPFSLSLDESLIAWSNILLSLPLPQNCNTNQLGFFAVNPMHDNGNDEFKCCSWFSDHNSNFIVSSISLIASTEDTFLFLICCLHCVYILILCGLFFTPQASSDTIVTRSGSYLIII